MTDPWFRPKSYGYGATPANWRGWAATAAFAIGLVARLATFCWGGSRAPEPAPAPRELPFGRWPSRF